MADIQSIDSLPALEELMERSREEPVWIFKHSLTCPISSHAWAEFRRFAADANGTVCAVVEIQKVRPVSHAVAERTGIRHESPQALLLRDGKVAWHASHYGIRYETLRGA